MADKNERRWAQASHPAGANGGKSLRRRPRMIYALWIVQGLLALIFLFAGGMKLVQPLEVLTEQTPLPGLVCAVYRRGRGARCARCDPPRAAAHSARPDTASRRRAGDYYDRCHGVHAGERCCCTSANPAGSGAPCGVRRLRPLAAGAALRRHRFASRRFGHRPH